MTEVQFAKQFLTVLDSKNTKYQSDHVFDPQTFQVRIPYTLPKLSHPPHPLPPKNAPAATPVPGSESAPPSKPPAANLTLKSSRNPTFTLHLPSLPLSTPITTLKLQVQSLLSGAVPPEKIKILYNKKPVPASKSTVYDVVTSEAGSGTVSEAEFGVMVMGGAVDPTPNVQTVSLNNEVDAAGPGSENAAVEAVTGVNPEDLMKGVETTPAATTGKDTEARQSEAIKPGDISGKELLSTKQFWDDLQGFLEQRLRDAEEASRLRALFEKVAK